MTKYLVTGGAGFIGSHIAEKLLEQGNQVRILDNFETGKEKNMASFIHQVDFMKGDIRHAQTCEKACDGIDYVFHQAALGSVPRSIKDPITTNEVNITGTLNMLMAAKKAGIKRFIYASSSSVYGNSLVLPKVETMSPNPLSPYALSKYAGEVYALQFYFLYGFETIALRYFNVFGPRQEPHSQYAAVIPKFISSLRDGKRPTIFGDGEQTRDFTYVADVVNANLLASQASEDVCGKTYNVACQKKISLHDLLKKINQLIVLEKPEVKDLQPIYEAFRPGDVKESLADINQSKSYLNYHPHFSLEEGLKKTVEYFLWRKKNS